MKKVLLIISGVIICSLVLGYVSFENKFTPEKNTLKVSNNTIKTEFEWGKTKSNEYASLLLPVTFKNLKETYYMQLDFGSPYTIFYKNSLTSIKDKNVIINENNRISLNFNINEMNIESNNFRVLDYGEKISLNRKINIVGTIGTDLLEKRAITLNFKKETFSFNENIILKSPTTFEFKKRRIILPAKIKNRKVKLMYDSGTSGYQLITDLESWKELKTKNSELKEEKGNSWGHTLTVTTASTNTKVSINNKSIELSEITYIKGTSKFQNFLMKMSGMQGMIGNKLFLNRTISLDCKNEKFAIE